MTNTRGNPVNLGQIIGGNATLWLSESERAKHLYVVGSTGTGKSKFIGGLLRQDIRNWRQSRCGAILLDPHGNLFDGIVNWLSRMDVSRPIIPIDLRQDDWVVSYNVLRQREAD